MFISPSLLIQLNVCFLTVCRWYLLQVLNCLLLQKLHTVWICLICSSVNHFNVSNCFYSAFLTICLYFCFIGKTIVLKKKWLTIILVLFYSMFSSSAVSYRFTFSLRRLISVMWPPSVDHWTTSATGQVSIIKSAGHYAHRLEICSVIQFAVEMSSAWNRLLNDTWAPSSGCVMVVVLQYPIQMFHLYICACRFTKWKLSLWHLHFF